MDEAEGLGARAAGDEAVEANEGTTGDEKDVARINLNALLLGVFATARGRDVANRALEELEQSLLHAFAGNIARDGGGVGLTADLIDFVDEDDAALGAFDVHVGGLQQAEDDGFDVVADVAGFGERGGIRDGERHVEHAREGLRKERLAGARRANQQDVALV